MNLSGKLCAMVPVYRSMRRDGADLWPIACGPAFVVVCARGGAWTIRPTVYRHGFVRDGVHHKELSREGGGGWCRSNCCNALRQTPTGGLLLPGSNGAVVASLLGAAWIPVLRLQLASSDVCPHCPACSQAHRRNRRASSVFDVIVMACRDRV